MKLFLWFVVFNIQTSTGGCRVHLLLNTRSGSSHKQVLLRGANCHIWQTDIKLECFHTHFPHMRIMRTHMRNRLFFYAHICWHMRVISAYATVFLVYIWNCFKLLIFVETLMVSYLILFKLGKMHTEGVRKFFWSQDIQKSAAIREKILSVSSPSRTIHITIFHSK